MKDVKRLAHQHKEAENENSFDKPSAPGQKRFCPGAEGFTSCFRKCSAVGTNPMIVVLQRDECLPGTVKGEEEFSEGVMAEGFSRF